MRTRFLPMAVLALGVAANMAIFVDMSLARGGRGGGGGLRGGGASSMSRGGSFTRGGGGSMGRGSSSFSRSSGGMNRGGGSFNPGGGSGYNRGGSSFNRSNSGFNRGSSSGFNRSTADTRPAGGRQGIGEGTRRADAGRVDRGDRGNRGDRPDRVDRPDRGDINIGSGNNINIDADGGWGGWDDHIHHPIAAGAVIGATAAVTAAAIGSSYYGLPPGCGGYPYHGYSYYWCGNYFLEPRYEGDTVVYVTVPDPRSPAEQAQGAPQAPMAPTAPQP
jgi:hypothetical protein